MDLQGATPVHPAPVNQTQVMHQLRQQQPQQQPPMQQQAPLHRLAMVYDSTNVPSNNYQALNHSYNSHHHHHHHHQQHQHQQQQLQQPLNSAYYGSHDVPAQVPVQPPPPPPPPPNDHQVVQYNMQPQRQASISPHDSWSNGSYYQPSQSPYPSSIGSQPYPQLPYTSTTATNQHGTPPCHQSNLIPTPNHNLAHQPISTPSHYIHHHSHPSPPSHTQQDGVLTVQPALINHRSVLHQQPPQQPLHQQQPHQQPQMHQQPPQLQQPIHHHQQQQSQLPQTQSQPPIHQQQPPIHQQVPPPIRATMVYDNTASTNAYSAITADSPTTNGQSQTAQVTVTQISRSLSITPPEQDSRSIGSVEAALNETEQDSKESQLSQLHQQCAILLNEQQQQSRGGGTISSPSSSNLNNNNGTNTSNNNSSGGNATTSSINSSNSGRSKRLRTSFKHHQLKEMKRWFAKNQNPDAKDLKTLSQTTGLSKRVLQVWFQNARAKFRRNNARIANQQLYEVNQQAQLLQYQQQQVQQHQQSYQHPFH